MNTISSIYFLYWISVKLSSAHIPSVSLILNGKRHWSMLRCPNTTFNNPSVAGNKVILTCHLTEDLYSKVPESSQMYHATFFVLYDVKIMDRCISMDQCFAVKMKQVLNTVSVNIESLRPCFSGSVSFRYELRQTSNLISNGTMEVFLSYHLKTPTRMAISRSKNTTNAEIILKGTIESVCPYDLGTLRYTMTYQLMGEPECIVRDVSKCTIEKININLYSLSCPLHASSPCEENLLCSSILKARIFGKSDTGKSQAVESRQFSKSLASVTARSISPNVSDYTLNSITFNFLKPVTCIRAHHHFVYKVKYKVSMDENWIDFQGHVCNLKTLHCKIHITGLKMKTNYTVCILYRNIFDIDAQYSEPVCRNASTAQLPCQPPVVSKIVPVEDDSNHWKAIVYWINIQQKCWNDEFEENSTTSPHHYLIEITDGNITTSLVIPHPTNTSSNHTIKLRYHQNYILTMSSCNYFGCLNGQKIHISVQNTQDNLDDVNNRGSKQKVTETILICVLSLLFLGASSFLYFILKKRKQFHRLRIKRKLKPSDIKIVRENCEPQQIEMVLNKISRRGIEMDSSAQQQQQQQEEIRLLKENRLVTVDTRPLIIRKMSTTDALEIPNNSSLV